VVDEPAGPRFSLSRADAVDWLGDLPDGSVDLVVTDPPYESLEKHRARGTTTRLSHSKASSNDWFAIFPNHRFERLFCEIHRVLKPNTHFYLFCDQETMFVAKPIAESVGFRFWKPLVWDKVKIGMGYHYRARYELILFFEKGKRKLNDLGVPDVITAARIHRGYPTEKPPAVSEVLVRQSTEPGDLVIDPFLGAGSVGVASIGQQRHFVGNDVCEEAIEISRGRLRGAGGVEVERASLTRGDASSAGQLGLDLGAAGR
jgi:site-specific DNA-methyltransferase (adenine-specific)